VSLAEKAKEEAKLVAYYTRDAVTVQTSFEKKFPQIKFVKRAK